MLTQFFNDFINPLMAVRN